MKTNYQTNKKASAFAAGLAKAILPFLFLLVSVETKAQCAVTGTPSTAWGCQYQDAIDTFTLNNISSGLGPQCGPNGYTYSPTPNWNLLMGNVNTFSATLGAQIYQEGFAIWIDMNQNGFYDANEMMASQAPALSTTGTFVIPFSATPGQTKMRLRTNYYTMISGATSACDYWTYGETEDYLITIVAPTPCSGAPGSNSAAVTPTSPICPGGMASLNLTNTYSLGGITYSWQVSNTSSSGPWTAAPSGTAFTLQTPTLSTSVWYQAIITCTNTNQSTVSSPVYVQVAGTTTSTVPYFEGFEGIQFNNQLPNCSWAASSPSNVTLTYNQAQTQNRVPRTGSKFASFYYTGNVNHFFTNGIWMDAGVTYSASMWYTTEYYGYTNWADLSIMLGTSQSTTGLTQIASTNGAAVSPSYKSLSNTFTVATSGLYYVGIRGTSTGACCGYYLSWDDLKIEIPCSLNTVSVTLSTNSSTVCAGTPVTINANGANTYSWNTGATTSAITSTPNANTNYNVVGMSTLTGCSGAVSQYIVVNPTPVVSIFSNNNSICKGTSTSLFAYGANSYQWSSGSSSNPISVSPSVTTSYSVIGANSFGCNANAVIQVSVMNLPTIAASGSANQLCIGESVTLTATGGTSYQWVSNNAFIQGSTAVVSPVANTSYVVTGTDANGCTNTATVSLNVSGCVGLKEVTASGAMVYPNPSHGEFTVELTNKSVKSVEVTDVTGRIIQSQNVNGSKLSFNLSNLANGIYYVRLVSGNSSETVKVIKD